MLETISAMIVGRFVGRGIFYGFLGKQMAIDGVRINMIFGHSDHAAGLRPIGDFYFFQATATALPVLFFAFWVLMMPVWSTSGPMQIQVSQCAGKTRTWPFSLLP